MYTKPELAIIIKNCNNSIELLHVCQIIELLILYGDVKKSNFLTVVSKKRSEELQILGL